MDAGWYNDPDDATRARWHDGNGWTEHRMVKSDWAGPGAPPPPGRPPMQPAFASAPSSLPPPDRRTEAAMAKARYKASRPWWKRKRIMLPLIGLVGIVGCSALISSAADDVEKDQEEREASIDDDAELVDCTTDDLGFMVASVKITNNSEDRSNYSVDVTFTSPDGSEQYASGSASALGLASGQTTTQDSNSLEDADGRTFECEITDVFRFTDEP